MAVQPRSKRRHPRGVRGRWAGTASVLLLFAVSAAPQTSPRAALLGGPARGILELPSGVEGFMLGALYDSTGSRPLFALSARLVPSPVLCPACFLGRIEGTLDDGVGPGPDFTVRGFYTGTTFDGRGSFDLAILRPGGARVGRIRGRLLDPPLSPDPGIFRGTWRFRR
jgi:hypothetical protein